MGRSPCCEKQHTNKGAWTKEEDELLVNYINSHGEGSWRSLPKSAGLLRCGKSCRLRWINYLRPDLKRGNFAEEEDEIIVNLHRSLGNKWSMIAARLPGRTDNEIKNYWNTHIKRKLISRGIDPVTHHPVNSTTTMKVEMESQNSSAGESNTSSGLTTEENYPTPNLELCLGTGTPIGPAIESKVEEEKQSDKGVCLCYNLGQTCNCEASVSGDDVFTCLDIFA